MTDEEIVLVKNSWKIFRKLDPFLVGDIFYSKLFLDHPSLRRLFPKQMDAQYKKLVDMLNSIVVGLDVSGKASEELIKMGQRHKGYAVKPAHYKMVGTALLWTLAKGLGADFTPATRAAWEKCYAMVANAMLSGAGEMQA